MKFNKLNSIVPPGQEQVFTSVSQQCSGHHIQMQFVCFEYCTDSGVDGVDCLFLGSETGCVYVYPIHKIAFARSLHPEEISRESPHGGQITSLIYLPARSWQPRRVAPTQALPASSTDPSPSSGGPGDADPALLVSGGLDRTIKVWMPRSRNGSHYVQTLYGHEGKISCLVDGHDGSFLSCASDGALKIWSPQRGRQLMRLPFFECTFSLNSTSRCWLTSMLVNYIGVWTCIVGDSSGSLEVYRKSLQGELGNEAKVASFNGAVLRYKRWDKVHSLGVVQVVPAHDEKFVISLSSDGTAKIVDISLGAIFFSINNPRKCIYTGVLWIPSKLQFCLSDELGNVELWSLLLERKVNECNLVPCLDKSTVKSIISTHRAPLLGVLKAHKETRNFLAILPRSGDVVLWRMAEETTCIEYLSQVTAETCMIVGFGLIPQPLTGVSKSCLISDIGMSVTEPIVGSVASILHAVQSADSRKDVSFSTSHSEIVKTSVQHESLNVHENSFFTVDQDGICRCWDEYDKTERYTFRAKGTQVSCVKFVWSMNCLAVGHRNGVVSFWNLDSGLRFTSCKQLQTVSCMEIAKAKNCDVLIVTDFSGNIMMLNLALFKMNPLQISIDATFSGYHDTEEPAILALVYHSRTGVVFSGGDDRSIRFWRLPKDVDFRTAESHTGAVCCLATTDHTLISGDEEGRINVWIISLTGGYRVSSAKVDPVDPSADAQAVLGDAYSSRRSTLPTLQLVGSWNLGSYAAIRSLSSEEVHGGVYISYISRMNRTSVHFLCFMTKTEIPEINKEILLEADSELSQLSSLQNASSAKTAEPTFEEQSSPSSLSLLPSSNKIKSVRRNSSAVVKTKMSVATDAPHYSQSVNWEGLRLDGEFVLDNLQQGTGVGADIDGGDGETRKFGLQSAYAFVTCTDMDEFSSNGLGKEPTCVHIQCDEVKNICYAYVGTENGSIYKYTSTLSTY